MTMNPRFLEEVGNALYGPRWKTDLSRDLGVSARHLHRWLDGYPTPQDLERQLVCLCKRRMAMLEEVMSNLPDPGRRVEINQGE